MDTHAFAAELREIDRRYAPSGGGGGDAYAKQLADWRLKEPDREEVCNTREPTSAWLLLWLCTRYGIRPFRRLRQKPTTICVRVPKGFMSKVLWPQLEELAAVFVRARAAAVDELVTAWLGVGVGDQPIVVEEETAPPR